jgi:hypothetical protein
MRHDIGEKHSREETGNVVIPVHNGFSFRLAALERFWQLPAFMLEHEHNSARSHSAPRRPDHSVAEDVNRRNWRYRTQRINIDAHITAICCAGVNDDGMVCFTANRRVFFVLSRPPARETPSTRIPSRQMARILFDLEARFATWAGCASPGCEILSSVSLTYGLIC